MNIEEINGIISNYDKLVALTESKIKVIEKLDKQYNTARGIEEISFVMDDVLVKCDDSCRGCYDSSFFTFPIVWLSKTDAEVEELVITAKELKDEKERKVKKEKQLKEKKEVEQRELEQYKRLKAKFEQ
jgi:hypothetical protein